MSRIRGETRLGYFHIMCEACNEHIVVETLRWDNGVPMIEFKCETCNSRSSLKLMVPYWVTAIPQRK